MIQTTNAEKFIATLNRRTEILNGRIRKRSLSQRGINGTNNVLYLPEDRRLDLIIEGPDTRSVALENPAAEMAMRDRAIWLNRARTNRSLVIILFPEAGRVYPERFKNFLVRGFPNITWYFPRLEKNLRTEASLYPHILARAFVQVGALNLTLNAQMLVDRHLS